MTPKRWLRIDELFRLAVERDPDERITFLREACAADPALADEVEALLDEHERTGTFLKQLIAAESPAGPARIRGTTSSDPYRLVGTTIDGRFRVDAPLGRGGSGVVYRATHLALQRPVALKMLHDERIAREESVERFKREALAIARLNHPNIVTIHDLALDPDVGAYIVMEFLDGTSLHEALRARRPLPLADVLAVVVPVCSALTTAHAHGVIHRDVKPGNIFLEAGPGGRRVKVLDFGIAKLQSSADDGRSDLTGEGKLLGTPGYMSPEQCGDMPVDTRTDIYSLGCVVYEMLTGSQPFAAENAAALLIKHLTVEPAPPSESRPGLPTSVDAVVLRALAKHPNDRYQTADDLAAALVEACGEASPSEELTLDTLHHLLPGLSDATSGDTSVVGASGTLGRPARGIVDRPVAAPSPRPDPSRERGGQWRLAVGLALALAVAAGTAYAVWPPRSTGNGGVLSPAPVQPPVVAPPARVEALRYSVEVNGRHEHALWTGDSPLPSGTEIRLHLLPATTGFLYIVAPGRDGVSTTLLTARPPQGSGLTGNALDAGREFRFPAAGESWIRLVDRGYATRFTVLLSHEALDEPAFLRTASGHALTPAEQQQWDALCAPYRGHEFEVDAAGLPAFTAVAVPADSLGTGAVAFDIEIRHR